jgi:hypothetical protein
VSFELAHHVVKISAKNKELELKTSSDVQDILMSKHLQHMQQSSSVRHNGLYSTMPAGATPGHFSGMKVGDQGCGTTKHVYNDLDASPGLRESVNETASEAEVSVSPRRRKISISGKFVSVGLSSPSSRISVAGAAYADTTDRGDCSSDDVC